MKVYNTLSGKKEDLVTMNGPELNIYVCGPTTYNFIHLGNARPLVVFDTLRRYLAYRGYQVHYVQNFTDVDDKIINRAREEGEEPLKLAERYIAEYFRDADALGIRRADVHPRVSEHIEDIIQVIEKLIEKGYAYVMDGDVYYRVRAFKGYGKLSGRTLDDMQAGARVEVDERKEDPMDFALWKKAKAGEPAWESPWSAGRPGWHIECSVMSMKYLGETLDVHGGGADLIFPHHENEIAQSEAYTGKPFANYWMHNGFITVKSEKMSKSLGNFFILRDILAKYPSDVVRYYLIATHYRSPLDFDDGKLEEARKAMGRLKNTLILAKEFSAASAAAADEGEAGGADLLTEVKKMRDSFIEAMDDDFNTARALGYLFEISHQLNSFVAGADPSSISHQLAVQEAYNIFRELGDILGIFMDTQGQSEELVDSLLELILDLRLQARAEKDYALGDSLREMLNQKSVKVEDFASGSRFRYEIPPQLEELMEALMGLRQTFRKNKEFERADFLRNSLKERGIILEDTKAGVRWKLAEA